jgi:hypothetical protein
MIEKFPKTIYKYRDWKDGNHQKLLIDNELYTPSVNQINDPFDCLINFDYSDLEKGNLTLRATDILFKEFGNELDKLGYDQLSLLDIKGKEDLSKITCLKKKFDKELIQNRKKYLGVISFSKRWDSILMWSHYSNCHTGFCLGFKTEKLIHSGYFNNGHKVHYKRNYPKVDPFDTDFEKIVRVFYNKSKDWEYEQEYRMTKLFGYNKDDNEFKRQKLFYFNDDFISEIVIGMKTSDTDRDQIIQICKEKNVSLYQIEDVPYKFELTRKQIFKASEVSN